MEKKYTFGVWIDVMAEDEDSALTLFEHIISNPVVDKTYCFEWKEVE